jgi:hypothetical protein
MIKPEDRHRVGKARLLRRQGKTHDEIREVIGEVGKDVLAAWLRGIPRPPETNRSGRSKPELRRKARQLRAEGMTIGEISEITGVGKGSISPWIRDIALPPRVEERRQQHLQQLRSRGGRVLSERARLRRELVAESAYLQVRALSASELFAAGVALYWAEGTKDKPWRRNGRVKFINSDATVLRLFLDWLDLLGVAKGDLKFRLNIHETADVPDQERWWQCELGLPPEQFGRATLKRHNPKPGRHNVGEEYHGCLAVDVAKSSDLYYSIEGWWRAIVAAAADRPHLATST